jgi:hypothetical protein
MKTSEFPNTNPAKKPTNITPFPGNEQHLANRSLDNKDSPEALFKPGNDRCHTDLLFVTSKAINRSGNAVPETNPSKHSIVRYLS